METIEKYHQAYLCESRYREYGNAGTACRPLSGADSSEFQRFRYPANDEKASA